MRIILSLLIGVCVSNCQQVGVDRTASDALDLDKLFARIRGKLFSSKCEGEDRVYLSSWSKCVWPRGDLSKIIKNFIDDAKEQGCKTPPARLIRVGIESLQNKSLNEYAAHPLYKNIPEGECGFCGRKARCCTNSQSFLTQSFEGRTCSRDSTACTIPQLNPQLRAELQAWYPDITPPWSPCDFKIYLDKEIETLRASKAFKFAKPLMCQVIGSTKPTLECVSEGNVCKCCCHGYKYSAGHCIPIVGYIDRGECNDINRKRQQ